MTSSNYNGNSWTLGSVFLNGNTGTKSPTISIYGKRLHLSGPWWNNGEPSPARKQKLALQQAGEGEEAARKLETSGWKGRQASWELAGLAWELLSCLLFPGEMKSPGTVAGAGCSGYWVQDPCPSQQDPCQLQAGVCIQCGNLLLKQDSLAAGFCSFLMKTIHTRWIIICTDFFFSPTICKSFLRSPWSHVRHRAKPNVHMHQPVWAGMRHCGTGCFCCIAHVDVHTHGAETQGLLFKTWECAAGPCWASHL